MIHLKTYENDDDVKLAIGAIESYIKMLFFDGCLSFAYSKYDITQAHNDAYYIYLEFHSVDKNVVSRLEKLANFLNIEWKLEIGDVRAVQILNFRESDILKIVNDLEMLSKSKQYNL